VEEVHRKMIELRKINFPQLQKMFNLFMAQHQKQKEKAAKERKNEEKIFVPLIPTLLRKLCQSMESQPCCDGDDENKDVEKFSRIPDPIKKRDILKYKWVKGIVMSER
jgi:hypothetical protein